LEHPFFGHPQCHANGKKFRNYKNTAKRFIYLTEGMEGTERMERQEGREEDGGNRGWREGMRRRDRGDGGERMGRGKR
jgi:hypothetical protein